MRSARLLPLILAGMLSCLPLAAQARGHHHHASGTPQQVAVSGLPPEARDTLALIQQGGPYPYRRDGIVFSNREHRLPQQPRGYYHEYTVKMPGVRTRGPRRIVCGPPTECYYSADHYRSFRRIMEGK